jgi:predicted ribosome quality control (RQC) complex YloA/Tae2 family protein
MNVLKQVLNTLFGSVSPREKIPSCHVILLSNDTPIKNIHKNVIKYCATLCKEGSKQKNYSKVSIIYTEIQNVSINKKGDVGSVTTRKTTKIIV